MPCTSTTSTASTTLLGIALAAASAGACTDDGVCFTDGSYLTKTDVAGDPWFVCGSNCPAWPTEGDQGSGLWLHNSFSNGHHMAFEEIPVPTGPDSIKGLGHLRFSGHWDLHGVTMGKKQELVLGMAHHNYYFMLQYMHGDGHYYSNGPTIYVTGKGCMPGGLCPNHVRPEFAILQPGSAGDASCDTANLCSSNKWLATADGASTGYDTAMCATHCYSTDDKSGDSDWSPFEGQWIHNTCVEGSAGQLCTCNGGPWNSGTATTCTGFDFANSRIGYVFEVHEDHIRLQLTSQAGDVTWATEFPFVTHDGPDGHNNLAGYLGTKGNWQTSPGPIAYVGIGCQETCGADAAGASTGGTTATVQRVGYDLVPLCDSCGIDSASTSSGGSMDFQSGVMTLASCYALCEADLGCLAFGYGIGTSDSAKQMCGRLMFTDVATITDSNGQYTYHAGFLDGAAGLGGEVFGTVMARPVGLAIVNIWSCKDTAKNPWFSWDDATATCTITRNLGPFRATALSVRAHDIPSDQPRFTLDGGGHAVVGSDTLFPDSAARTGVDTNGKSVLVHDCTFRTFKTGATLGAGHTIEDCTFENIRQFGFWFDGCYMGEVCRERPTVVRRNTVEAGINAYYLKNAASNIEVRCNTITGGAAANHFDDTYNDCGLQGCNNWKDGSTRDKWFRRYNWCASDVATVPPSPGTCPWYSLGSATVCADRKTETLDGNPDPTCARGQPKEVGGSNICFPHRCNQLGGSGCGLSAGDGDFCCTGHFGSSPPAQGTGDRPCSSHPSPCVMTTAEYQQSLALPAPSGAIPSFSRLRFQQLLPFPTPLTSTPPGCTLQCGTAVAHGWSGACEGPQSCNSCWCWDGTLSTTLMYCLNPGSCGGEDTCLKDEGELACEDFETEADFLVENDGPSHVKFVNTLPINAAKLVIGNGPWERENTITGQVGSEGCIFSQASPTAAPATLEYPVNGALSTAGLECSVNQVAACSTAGSGSAVMTLRYTMEELVGNLDSAGRAAIYYHRIVENPIIGSGIQMLWVAQNACKIFVDVEFQCTGGNCVEVTTIVCASFAGIDTSDQGRLKIECKVPPGFDIATMPNPTGAAPHQAATLTVAENPATLFTGVTPSKNFANGAASWEYTSPNPIAAAGSAAVVVGSVTVRGSVTDGNIQTGSGSGGWTVVEDIYVAKYNLSLASATIDPLTMPVAIFFYSDPTTAGLADLPSSAFPSSLATMPFLSKQNVEYGQITSNVNAFVRVIAKVTAASHNFKDLRVTKVEKDTQGAGYADDQALLESCYQGGNVADSNADILEAVSTWTTDGNNYPLATIRCTEFIADSPGDTTPNVAAGDTVRLTLTWRLRKVATTSGKAQLLQDAATSDPADQSVEVQLAISVGAGTTSVTLGGAEATSDSTDNATTYIIIAVCVLAAGVAVAVVVGVYLWMRRSNAETDAVLPVGYSPSKAAVDAIHDPKPKSETYVDV